MAARVDASGVAVELASAPRRIVSLVPSITETLCALGLADALVGITVYCVEPRELVKGKTRVGGEKNPDLEKIRSLEPQLVIANIEENLRDHVETLRSWSIPVWVTYPRTVADGIRLVTELGAVTETQARASASWVRSSRSTSACEARPRGAHRWRSSIRSGAGRT
jgi:ABC-type Fe3+-hydroxamate transport system substrate-binding protein